MITKFFRNAIFAAASAFFFADLSAAAPADPFGLGLAETPQKAEYLSVSEAFADQPFVSDDGKRLTVKFSIAPEYYLYRHMMRATDADGRELAVETKAGLPHTDEFMGDSEVYFIKTEISVNTEHASSPVSYSFQGCTQGMCYQPVRRSIALPAKASHNSGSEPSIKAKAKSSDKIIIEQPDSQNLNIGVWEILAFLGVGIALAFTPCVFPMYPVLSMILFGGKKRQGAVATLPVTFCFTEGIAVTYAVLGILAGMFGSSIHAFLQSPAVLIAFSCVFAILSASMLGLFELSLPASWSQKLTSVSDRQKSGSLLGAFIIGCITALVCSPCTTAPISATLLYTISDGNAVAGGICLYLLGLGMGLPMLAIGAFGKKALPRPGKWMDTVKRTTGILSLCVPLFLLNSLMPPIILPAGCSLLVLIAAIYVCMRHSGIMPRLITAALSLSLLAFCFLAGEEALKENSFMSRFSQISSLQHAKSVLDSNGEVLIDLKADWCSACKQYEHETFADPRVQERLLGTTLYYADMTEATEETARMSDELGIKGLPSLIFKDKCGNMRILGGFLNAEELLEKLSEGCEKSK